MQPSRGCIVKKTEGGAFSAEDGTGADARPSASRTAGRPSAPPGRGQAAKAVFRRRRMARIRRMRGAPQAGRAARWQARTTTERPNAPAPTARDFAPAADAPARKGAEREEDAPEANLPIGERRGRERNGPFRPERTVGAKSRACSGGAQKMDRHRSPRADGHWLNPLAFMNSQMRPSHV